MDTTPRYEIVSTIASGDFATVYRARDRELGREVAIKQIHQQFLADPRQLARYWQEAQLLASLQHPNVVTIYDIVRPRGWLILELMRGSLKETAQGEPIDLDFLRVVLGGCLNALQFLHANGVIHGDVKPSNMLVGAQNRVKLGDFGLARRANNEEGSLLKGTTKYMAPELLSPQFGAVGPPSDLYSLGFSAYELICGGQFESLFPGLGSYGRDKQIAWMMWHATADRKLPEIRRVLEGVPEDLARVVEKLIVKDQARRYQSAQEVLRDLQAGGQAVEPLPEQDEAAAEIARLAEAKKKRRLRYAAILAMAFSLMLCVLMLLPKKVQPPVVKTTPTAVRGLITQIYPDEFRLAIKLHEDGGAKEIKLNESFDKVFINGEPNVLRELRKDDEVEIKKVRESGREITQVWASRPGMSQGTVKLVKPELRSLLLTLGGGADTKGKELEVVVPRDVRILFNGNAEYRGKPIELADLKPGDRAVVHHKGAETVHRAVELSIQRVVKAAGVIGSLDLKKNKMTVDTGTTEKPQRLELPFAPSCEISLNGRAKVNEQFLKPADLKPGDQVNIEHDLQVVRVEAYRVETRMGKIEKILLSGQTPQIDVLCEGDSRPTTYIVGPRCKKITLGGEPVALEDLRDGDQVEISHDTLDAKTPEAVAVAATRPADSRRWAILIGVQNYQDTSLSPAPYAVEDAKLLHATLTSRYQVPPGQAVLLTDEEMVRLEQTIPDRLSKIGPDGKLIVYFTGHAYKDDQGKVYLTPKNFDAKRPALAGLALQSLVDQLEQCKAKEKLLLLDCTQSGPKPDAAREPSTAEMMRTLDAPPGRSPLRTLVAVASCKAGQRGLALPGKGHGLFAWCLAEGYAGRADTNRDGRLEPSELFTFLKGAMTTAASEAQGVQTPELILPDDRPPRLSEDAKQAIRRLAALLAPTKVDIEALKQQYTKTVRLSGKEPEPKLIAGLILLKAKESDAVLTLYGQLKLDRPQLLLPLRGIVWARFNKRTYQAGIADLGDLIARVPKPKKPGDPYSAEAQEIFRWAGQLREFAGADFHGALRPSDQSLAALDAAVAAHGAAAQAQYEAGRTRSAGVISDFDKRIAAAEDQPTALNLAAQRRQLGHYAEFPFDASAAQVLSGLDNE